MKVQELTEWKQYKKIPPEVTAVRKLVSKQIKEIATRHGLRRKHGTWAENKLFLQFWKDSIKVENEKKALTDIRRLPNVRSVKKKDYVFDREHSIEMSPAIIINIDYEK